jgi:hypothetical protein
MTVTQFRVTGSDRLADVPPAVARDRAAVVTTAILQIFMTAPAPQRRSAIEAYLRDEFAQRDDTGEPIMTDNTSDNSTIEIKLVRSTFLTRWPCTVCGGCTEKVLVLAEAPMPDAELPSGWPTNPAAQLMRTRGEAIRVCESCLEAGNVDARLAAHADQLEVYADALRALTGRLRVPSYAQWLAACKGENRRDSLWHYASRASTKEEVCTTVAAQQPDLLPLTEAELDAAWHEAADTRAAIARAAAARGNDDDFDSIPF